MIDDGSQPGTAASILKQCGRAGVWYTHHDPTSSQTPDAGNPVPSSTTSPPNGASAYVETYGTLSNSGVDGPYGASIGCDFDAPSGTPQDYNVASTGYSGVSFWIRVAQAIPAQPNVLVQLVDANTAPIGSGAYWHQYQLPAPPPNTWTKYSVPWSAFHQGMMTEPMLDLSRLRSMYWQLNETSPGSNTPQPFDVSIGDVEFTP
jgi:hypothetical protein